MFGAAPRDTIGDMTRFLILAVLLSIGLALPTGPALSEDGLVRIASGRKGGTYRSVYSRNLEPLMRGYKLVYLKSEGSGQNLDLLAEGKADVAFAQADIFAAKRNASPIRFENIMVIGRIAPECVFLAYKKDGPVASLADLAIRADAGEAKVAVGAATSGMAGTWSFMSTLMGGLDEVQVDHTTGTLALNQLAVGAFDAAGWVTDPDNHDHKMLRALLANDRLALMPLTDAALYAKLADGTTIYEPSEVEFGNGMMKTKLQTVCTSAMMFARKDAGERLIDKLSDVVSLHLDEIVKPR